MVRSLFLLALFLLVALTATIGATPAFSSTTSERPAVHSRPAAELQLGTASHYGRAQAGRRTASGERLNPEAMTCAHRTLPLGSVVKVTAIATGRQVTVKVNDRGPYVRGRILDLSDRAARELGIGARGVTQVSIEVTGGTPG
jgi:rare lipoprotein A